jgi:hypothetical protein
MTTRQSIALILSPIGVLLISAARLIIVANFNTTTAVTIASSGGFINTLLGTVIPLVPVFMPYFALLLLLSRHFLLSILAFAFTAFITPTSITLTDVIGLVQTDWYHVVDMIYDNRRAIFMIVLVILVLLWVYNRSLPEALSAVAAVVVAGALLFALPNTLLTQRLQLAGTNEHRIVLQASSGAYGFSGPQILMALIVLAIVFIFLAYPRSFDGQVEGYSWMLSVALALIATIALFPYVRSIYPVPQHRNYYAEAAHAMWLPAEKITLSTHRIYYGYILSSSSGWFTVLSANSRTIIYLSADNVVGRSVCQPRLTAQPKQYPPLVPWLYHPPPQLPACASYDGTTSITSFLSKGESLIEISLNIQRCPWTVISVTNAHAHEKLSRGLRAYERAHKWYEPTPVGQRFWYYPRFKPGHYSCQPSHISW